MKLDDITKQSLLGHPERSNSIIQSDTNIPYPVNMPSSAEITCSEPSFPPSPVEKDALIQQACAVVAQLRQKGDGGGVAKELTVKQQRFAPTPPNSLGKLDSSASSGAFLTPQGAVVVNGRVVDSARDGDHKPSFSEREHHQVMQAKYRQQRRRHWTDPVDFEGILNIIGGCSWWQIWVYGLISFQQIPHAMFNLAVVYMMFSPDHWCKVPGLDLSSVDHGVNWTWPMVLDTAIDRSAGENYSTIAYPETIGRYGQKTYSSCKYLDRDKDFYHSIAHQDFEEAVRLVRMREKNASIPKPTEKRCEHWIYDKTDMEDTIVTQWDLVCSDNVKRAHAHLAYSLGFLFGCLLSGFSSDRFGRKPTVIGFGILSSMFGLILPYSTYFPMFLLIRFLGAVCNEAADLAAYVLCMEITGTKYRAMVGSLLQAPWAVGYALLALLAYLTKSWKSIQIITAIMHTITVLLVCVLPESPRWLIVNNRVREAGDIIRKACRMNQTTLPPDLELVKHAEQRKWVKRNQRANLLHLFKNRVMMIRTLIIYCVWVATALVYYGLVIALSDQSAPGRTLFSGNFFVNNAIAGAIELPTLLGCVFLLRFGRKKSQMFTLIGGGLLILGAMFFSTGPMAHTSTPALVLMLLGKVCIQAAFNILYIFTSELYPTVIRNSAVGTSSMVARLGSSTSSYIAILSDVSLQILPMMIFSIFSLGAGLLVVFLPETKDQPLPDTLQDSFLQPARCCSPRCLFWRMVGCVLPSIARSHGPTRIPGCECAAPVDGYPDTPLYSQSFPLPNGNCAVDEAAGGGGGAAGVEISIDDTAAGSILREMAELDLPSHPDQLPETS